jgi:hypothetical protein
MREQVAVSAPDKTIQLREGRNEAGGERESDATCSQYKAHYDKRMQMGVLWTHATRDPEWRVETTAFARPVTGMLRPRYQRADLNRESEIKRIYYLHIALRAAYYSLRGRHAAANAMLGKHSGNYAPE